MKAVIATGQGRISYAEVAAPEPSPGHLVVEVGAFSINRGETYQLEHPRSGWRPGKDLAGIVVCADPDGSGPPVGTRIVAHTDEAAWAQRVLVPVDRVAELPDEISDVTAAALPLAGLTAVRLLRVTGALPSRRVLFTGASGGVGHYFVELAAGQGALVTAVTRSAERGNRLTELGAVEVATDVEQIAGPFDVAIESIGGATIRAVWHRLEPHGLLVWIGQASRERPKLDYFDWDGAMSVTIRKFNYMDSTHNVSDDLATLVRLTASGRLHPELGLVQDWSTADEAIEALVNRQVRGNAVLTIGTTKHASCPSAS